MTKICQIFKVNIGVWRNEKINSSGFGAVYSSHSAGIRSKCSPKKDKVIRGTVSVSNYVYATASSVDKPSSASAVAYTQAEILKNGMAALGVTQASASGNSAYVYSDQTLSGHFTSK